MDVRNLLLLLFFLNTPFLGQSQSKPKPGDFQAYGDAVFTGDQCFQLTNAYNWSGGSIWYKKGIDLHASFSLELSLMMGCKDVDGADGMAFVFHPEFLAQGYQGEGMGFAGLRPSLIVEIDTWENEHLGDPPQDHVALLRDGSPNHRYGLAGPNIINNIEDCRQHKVKLDWNPQAQSLQLSIDNKKVLTYSADIVKKIFHNNPVVYFGVTSATGAYNNRHEICFETIKFREVRKPALFTTIEERKLLKGEAMTLDQLRFDAGKTHPKPEGIEELDKLVKLLKDNPEMGVEIGAYTDSSGDEIANQKISQKRAEAIEDYLAKEGISRKRIYPHGYGEERPIASNNTPDGRMKNRRIEIKVFRMLP
ncbi:MAG: hypothetical protein DHS20C18_45500 [Saprospiraceae bacterium]|nr:MAG: hypothetical protein DHS20C18_45500 [Saprospiraceae bacterium]